ARSALSARRPPCGRGEGLRARRGVAAERRTHLARLRDLSGRHGAMGRGQERVSARPGRRIDTLARALCGAASGRSQGSIGTHDGAKRHVVRGLLLAPRLFFTHKELAGPLNRSADYVFVTVTIST